MYLSFYGLKENPFSLVSDPRFLYYSESHCEALAHLLYALRERRGLTVLLGEAGTGKTILIRTLIEMLRSTQVVTCAVLNPFIRTREEFLETILTGFGVENAPQGVTAKADKLFQILEKEALKKHIPLLLVDEAQSVSKQLLEQLRLLTNFESDGQKLLQVVIAGQPEFADRINTFEFRALHQRIAVRARLRPLSRLETFAYLRARLERAGHNGKPIFTITAAEMIYRYSGGIPRVINTISDNTLLAGFARNLAPVGPPLVEEVCRQLELKPVEPQGTSPADDLLRAPSSWDGALSMKRSGQAPEEFQRFVEQLRSPAVKEETAVKAEGL